ncbi:ATP-binding protein, partial [Vibrio bivalvicida]
LVSDCTHLTQCPKLLGRITQSLSREAKLIARQDKTHTTIKVEDNGRGISEEDQSKIFQPFFTTLRARGGTGLGMHMVYNICTQKLRASIELESALGEGTKFTITLENRIDLEGRASVL